ncbi:helix-turn-helix domain-containing protein [Defluviimonas sp. WL0024]|uniref:Helix-turn-helix domain-containing protein n=1 Tax=Albidovulum salinarum TaxID=2984153 RepID=A0ABT2X8S0_9RHOB|nr:helix-turn-helix domain-containing protein [Defluviimonas sp. WL0024]MCU9850350.1 helix-turn-helix domain-containing protein [Defluviimonas sp. WL0024]
MEVAAPVNAMTQRTEYQWIGPKMAAPELKTPLKVGIVPTPDFTLLSLSCLVDYLRLAADESDFSRQIYCSWSVLSDDERPLVSSSGLSLQPTADMSNLDQYDCLVFHGGIMHSHRAIPQYIYDAIQHALDWNIPVAGLCTGQFLFAEMGLLDDRRCAVHFSLEPLLRRHFPRVTPISDQPVVEDGPFLTCPGGLAALNLGTTLVSRKCGAVRAEKVLHYLMADKKTIFDSTPGERQDYLGEHCPDRRVANAVGIMRQSLYERSSVSDIARQVGTSRRELTRLFNRYLRVSPAEYWRDIRLSAAHWMVVNTDRSIAQIAYESGFADSSHLIRWFQKRYELSPTALRRRATSTGGH